MLIGQLVKILKSGEEVRLSKRAGNIVTLEDFVETVGVDAVRYSLSRYPSDSPLTLDIDDITRKKNDNPVFYVQYAPARIASLSATRTTSASTAATSTRRCSRTTARPICWAR